MTLDDIELLLSPSVRKTVEDNIERDALDVAMDRRIENAQMVASQVKYLQRARTKLPSYYLARCIIPPIAFEQSSSEQTAQNKDYKGDICLDLTCGLGVDTLWLAKHFGRVIALERDPILAQIARVNFGLMGVDNVTVESISAEQFVADNPDFRADMIYIDPDRRGEDGRKKVTLADCSPNVELMMPRFKKIAPKIVVKLSPMFDVDEVFRIFGQSVRVEVVSLGGECKEVVVELDDRISEAMICATVIGRGRVEYPYSKRQSDRKEIKSDYRYIIVPDVALVKARVGVRYFEDQGVCIASENSFAFTNTLAEGILGKVYEIEHMWDYLPKKLKKELNDRGVKRVNIIKREFPQSPVQIARQLSVGEGGGVTIAFTTIASELRAMLLRPVLTL